MAHLIVVEDERELSALVSRTLQADGHTIETFTDGGRALERLYSPSGKPVDLWILDLMLPGVDGLEICRQIRRRQITPILMLTAKSTELDRVLGLELGADDYLTKPVSMRELQARVSAMLRRVEMMRVESRVIESDQQPIDDGGLRIDPGRREVLVDGQPVSLTAKEFNLLRLLAGNPGRAFSRDYLLDRVWGDDFSGFDRTIDTHIQRLRRKLGGHGTPADRIVTLWGVGYKYDPARTG